MVGVRAGYSLCLVLLLSTFARCTPDRFGPDPGEHYFDRDACANWTLDLIQKGNISLPADRWLFATDEANRTYHGNDNLTLSLPGCERICGPRTYYRDAGPRFMTWILPIGLLLCNIELSPIDKRRFATFPAVLGNSCEAIWSLMHKLQTWNTL